MKKTRHIATLASLTVIAIAGVCAWLFVGSSVALVVGISAALMAVLGCLVLGSDKWQETRPAEKSYAIGTDDAVPTTDVMDDVDGTPSFGKIDWRNSGLRPGPQGCGIYLGGFRIDQD